MFTAFRRQMMAHQYLPLAKVRPRVKHCLIRRCIRRSGYHSRCICATGLLLVVICVIAKKAAPIRKRQAECDLRQSFYRRFCGVWGHAETCPLNFTRLYCVRPPPFFFFAKYVAISCGWCFAELLNFRQLLKKKTFRVEVQGLHLRIYPEKWVRHEAEPFGSVSAKW